MPPHRDCEFTVWAGPRLVHHCHQGFPLLTGTADGDALETVHEACWLLKWHVQLKCKDRECQ